MKKYFKFLCIVCICISACKTKKVTIADGTEIKAMSARKVAKKHIASNFDHKTVDSKLKVYYQSNKEKLNFSVRMKIKKDEVIWLKGTKLITIFKAKITPDKVSFYSPYKKNYFEGDFSMLTKILGTEINFTQLQNMLLGQAIFDVKSSRQNIEISEMSYQLSPKIQQDLFDVFFFINPNHYKLNKQSLVNVTEKKRLDINYPKYRNKENTSFPEEIQIFAKEASKFTNITMQVRTVNFDTNLNLDFTIPQGYKEIQL